MAVVNSFALFFGAEYPLQTEVVDTRVAAYGDAVNVLNGSYDTGGAAVPNYPDPEQVLEGVAFGTLSSEEYVGRWRPASAATVLDTATFGDTQSLTSGTWHAPLQTEVIDTATFGPSNSLPGLFNTEGLTPCPSTPIMVSAHMLTLHDLVAHIMDVYDLHETPTDVRRAKRSALWGYEQAMTRHTWNIYDDEFNCKFNAQDTTGPISITAEGVVTRTEPWPNWVDKGSIYLDGGDSWYRVWSRDSDTQITLEDWRGDALTDVEQFSLRHDRVLLPYDVREVYDVWQLTDDRMIPIADVGSFRTYSRPWNTDDGDEPAVVTFRAVQVSGRYETEMRISPGAAKEIELSVAYMRRAKQPRVLDSVTGSSSGGVITLDKPLHVGLDVVGAIAQTAESDTDAPETELGYGFSDEVPITFEGFVTSQPSTTQIVVPGFPDIASAKIVLTDILDIPQWLFLAVKTYAEAQMARIGRGDIREYRTLMVEADEQLRHAMEQDGPYARRSNGPGFIVDTLERTPYVTEV